MWKSSVAWCIVGYMTTISGDVNKTRVLEDEIEGRIVGGKPVSIEENPSAVMLINRGAQCGGSILTSHAVLTAAHCFSFNLDTEDMMILVGSRFRVDHLAKRHQVAFVVLHEDYNKAMMFSCDVALVFVQTPIRFGPKAKRAVIVNSDKWMNRKQRNFIVTGWGMVKYNGQLPDALLMTQLHYIPRKKCNKLHKMNFTDGMFCLYGDGKRDVCRGDSGGGVLWNGKLVGIVSHGDGCAKRNKPSVYSNVWYFRHWIKRTLDIFYDKYYCKYIKSPKKTNNQIHRSKNNFLK